MIKSSSEGSIPEFKITSSPSFSSEPPGVYVQPRFYSSPGAQQADVKFSVDGEEMARSASDRNSRDYRPPSTSSRSSPRDRQIRSPPTSHLPSDSRTAIQSLEQRGYSASKSIRDSADVSWPPPPLLKDIISDVNPGSSFKRYIDSSCPPGSSFVRENPRSRCVRDICDEIIAQSFREDSSESGKKLKVFDSASFESSMRFSAKQSADASPSVGNSVISFDSLPVKTERGTVSIDVPTADSTERMHPHMGSRISPRLAERSSEDGSSSDSDNIALPSDESTRVSRSKSIVDFREVEIRCNSTDNVNISSESPGFPARSGSASSAVIGTDDVVVNERVKTEQTNSESVRLSPSTTASKRRHCDSSEVKPGDSRLNVSKENQPDDYEPSAKMPSLN